MKRQPLNTDSKTGLTLPELIVAIFILAIVSIGLLSVYINCSIITEQARNITIATGHADYTLEQIRNTDFASIPGTDWTAWAQTEGLDTLGAEQVNVNATGIDPLTITVTVNWTERGRSKSLQLVTEVTQ